VAKIGDTESSIFTCHGQLLAKTGVSEYSRSGWDREDASGELRSFADRDAHADQFQRSEFCRAPLLMIRPSASSSKTIDPVSQKSPAHKKFAAGPVVSKAVVDHQRLDSVTDLESELTFCLPFKKGLPKDNGTCCVGIFADRTVKKSHCPNLDRTFAVK
jgi:hypothetical protein